MSLPVQSPHDTVVDLKPTLQISPVMDEAAAGDPHLVSFDPDEPANPKNWSRARRWYLTTATGILALNATFASSAPTGIIPQLVEEFHLSKEVAVLVLSLFVAAYCVGPLLWGPLSEQYGRRPLFLWPFIVYTGFQIGCALSKNTASLLIFRFLGGFFAAAPLTNAGAVIADIWDSKTRGKAMSIFTLAPFAGPALGPTVGGYIAVGGASWRWLFWVLTIFAGLCCVMIYFTIPETYGPVLLVAKAKKMRKDTGDDKYYAPLETTHLNFIQRAESVIVKPFKILFSEPMLMAITLYFSFIYGCIYLSFEAFPIVYTAGHHMNAGASGLMFLPLPIGGAIGVLGYQCYYAPKYSALVDHHAPEPVPPEARLEMGIWGAAALVVYFFWFGWTSFPRISYWSPLLSTVLLGFGTQWVFMSLLNYTVDAYLQVAASALAATTVCRSVFGAVFPLFADQMYTALDPRWASSLLGFVALAMLPIPVLLIRYGPKLREKSKYAPSKPRPVGARKGADAEAGAGLEKAGAAQAA